jgi:general secretion pathway protein D
MLRHLHRRGFSRSAYAVLCVPLLLAAAHAQSPAASNAPASVPAGIAAAKPETIKTTISPKQARDAEDAYLEGAKQVTHNDLDAAERSFGRALKLNPDNPDYLLALAATRQQRITALVQQAARARLSGDNARSAEILAQAHTLDPNNPIVNQHLGPGTANTTVDPFTLPAEDIASTLAGPIELKPKPGLQSFHRRGSAQDQIRTVYDAYGIKVTFDPSVTNSSQIRLDVDDVSFTAATSIISSMTHVFAVPLQSNSVLVAQDTQESRDRLVPEVEETVYLPGVPADEMTELANVARTVFDVKQVTASATGGDILLRGDENTLRLLNATYDDMLDGGSDVLLDIRIYEVDKTNERKIGAQLPGYAGVFSIAAEAQQLVAANQSLIDQAIAAGVLKLNGSYLQNLIAEAAFLIGSGQVSAAQYSNLLGVFGNGLTFAGLYLGSSSTFNLMLNSSNVRTLDAVTLRAGNRQESTFRAGTRYPVVTATYSSGISSALSSQLSGLAASNPQLAALAAQYGGSSAVTVPQFQYEDLGLTLKTTPQIMHNGSVSLKLDMKIEALGGGTINSIPILNNRTLTSTIDVPAGQSAMLASLVNSSESKSIQGLPGLSELPGFQGTDQDTSKDSQELLITITPHIVRSSALHIASRRLSIPRPGNGAEE